MGPKLLLVGCGITNSVVAKLLISEFDKINITIWESLSVAGGRFCTVLGGKQNSLSCDLGAQYISTTDENMIQYDHVYSSLLNNNVLTLMPGNVNRMRLANNVKNYVALNGMASVVTHLLNEDKCTVCYNHKLIALHKHSDMWLALTDSGIKELFHAVILTIPVPEIFKLCGDIKCVFNEKPNIYEKLKSVNYSSRYALALFFEEAGYSEFDSEYINNDSIVRYVSYDSWKRNEKCKFYSVAVHTTIQFGEEHCESDLEVVKDTIIKHIYESVFPHWPKPTSVHIQRWDYSQVLSPYESNPGAVVLYDQPLIVIGGDGFIGSTFDHCLFSAKTIFDITRQCIIKYLQK